MPSSSGHTYTYTHPATGQTGTVARLPGETSLELWTRSAYELIHVGSGRQLIEKFEAGQFKSTTVADSGVERTVTRFDSGSVHVVRQQNQMDEPFHREILEQLIWSGVVVAEDVFEATAALGVYSREQQSTW